VRLLHALTDAPGSLVSAGLCEAILGGPSWSNDGKAILLPATFLKSKNNAPSRPCIAVLDLPSDTCPCVRVLKGETETGAEEDFHHAKMARFAAGDKHRVAVSFYKPEDFTSSSITTTEYQRTSDGAWRVAGQFEHEHRVWQDGFDVAVKQGLNDPPVLVATNKQTSRVIWDPNLQLKDIELVQASVYTWKDKRGRLWKGGLYKPSDHKLGRRYPLVIQTHDFNQSEFIPSGVLSTGFAARSLAAAGIVVVQISEQGCPGLAEEGPCAVSSYEGAATQLVLNGLVDAENIGIIGFSRTCFYVMETLIMGSLHFKAASITDGVMGTYLQYMTRGGSGNGLDREFDAMIGASPFGNGLQVWLKRSPGFNLDKINTPLTIIGEGPYSVLKMWEPYAGLHYLQKPVDLIMLNTDKHVLTNPAVRMASQGGSVDWFRFWLQDYEDPRPRQSGAVRPVARVKENATRERPQTKRREQIS
jgi:dipeptidyl aminopeptidase/acylaminoacyl peptidase